MFSPRGQLKNEGATAISSTTFSAAAPSPDREPIRSRLWHHPPPPPSHRPSETLQHHPGEVPARRRGHPRRRQDSRDRSVDFGARPATSAVRPRKGGPVRTARMAALRPLPTAYEPSPRSVRRLVRPPWRWRAREVSCPGCRWSRNLDKRSSRLSPSSSSTRVIRPSLPLAIRRALGRRPSGTAAVTSTPFLLDFGHQTSSGQPILLDVLNKISMGVSGEIVDGGALTGAADRQQKGRTDDACGGRGRRKP